MKQKEFKNKQAQRGCDLLPAIRVDPHESAHERRDSHSQNAPLPLSSSLMCLCGSAPAASLRFAFISMQRVSRGKKKSCFKYNEAGTFKRKLPTHKTEKAILKCQAVIAPSP